MCFEAFGEVINIWISPPPSYFGFVTFDSVESVNKTLASAPILLFGCHKLNVERKMPEHVSKGKRRGNNQPSSSGSDVQTPPSQDAASKEDLGPEDGSATAEIYWSDNEAEKEDVNLTEDDSWSQGESTDQSRSREDLKDQSRSGEDELVSNLTTILLQTQAQLEQKRLQWAEEKRANEAANRRRLACIFVLII